MNIYDLWFSSAQISSRLKLNILKRFSSVEEVWMNVIRHNTLVDSCESKYENMNVISALKRAWQKDQLELKMEYCYEKGIGSVNFNEDSYPSRLKNYEDSPAVLFYIGNVVKLDKNLNVGIVGSRKCSIYGRNAAEIISREISKNNINVISGMARGIDSYAHRGAIESNGYTCAVFGSGVDVIYPRENRKLYKDILANGAVVSEFIPGVKPISYNFPKRNRIISGLSDVLVVVEAAERSGALITADMALEQGKSVMAVPGSIFSEESRGTNRLIKQGAYPLTNIEDIFQILEVEYETRSVEFDKKSDNLTKTEQKIYSIIGDTPIHIDDISKIANVDIKQLYELLFELQLKKQIICLSGNYYVKDPDKSVIID
ncbi:MAG: DNA-processing protein DprA [Clostridium sp.]|jgi:DNA processing protein|uniref:DNA-processing protein DprA n=1 Tax=Clostridium sp. TaxID=1506 RepID=UPI0025C42CD7|nr:DNA-processing protein DprA [Clostridium sp.]MCH3963999.1 DNA-processing protein DprA [Clostridium sp.]MCI1716200.1 DNA-processing protein DprA [Clostridium sp.]MCI1800560.1 DNA-processing protein DprA [Clostridium sp.]MCI1814377.1 DNA-processing protein DprA [Clostridium sp.]MCI1871276.1 DNA-processing protein DprA [Clostridium sp.]